MTSINRHLIRVNRNYYVLAENNREDIKMSVALNYQLSVFGKFTIAPLPDVITALMNKINTETQEIFLPNIINSQQIEIAIAVTSSDITKMDFIIINTDLLTENSLEYKQTYAGQDIAIPDLQDTHYDIIGITIEKLVNCTKVYQRIVESDPNGETYIIRYAAGEIKDLLKCAIEEHRVDESKAPKKIKEQLGKLKAG